MQVTMQHAERLTLAEMREFLDASSNLSFAGTGRKQIYGLLEGVLRSQKYLGLAKKDKGIVRRYLVKISGLSVAQITRLIARWRERGVIEPRTARRYRFPQRYTNDDILLLATTDGAHEGLSAPAIRRILQREFKVHGQANYERLASISASHIYNLRRTRIYREQRVHHTKTRASAVAIGERRKPEPRGRPGFLRVDAVHQGDSGSRKGIYHINAVDTVTQWQNVGCCETISEAHFIPVLEAILHQFPYRILGFHSDNGSEFINYQVEKLLNKLLVGEFTKSRANRTTDNALVEGKNGAVVRKHIGHAPIAARHAEALQRFYTADFNPYLNYHRPCGFATVELADNGKRRRRYRLEDYRTPYEKLLSLNDWESCLKEGISALSLQQQALRMSDTECALRMQQRKRKLLDACRAGRAEPDPRSPSGLPAAPQPCCQGTEQRGPLGSIQLYRRTHPHSADPLEPECLESPPDSLPCFKSFTLYPLERRSSPSRLTFSALAHFRLILGLENAKNAAREGVKVAFSRRLPWLFRVLYALKSSPDAALQIGGCL